MSDYTANTMQYAHLIGQLQRLEQQWRGSPRPTPSPKLYPSHSLIRPSHNIQYFACSNTTAGKDLPVVVTVGVNYTQGTSTIPDQTPSFSKAAQPGLPLVEDNVDSSFEENCIGSFNLHSVAWKRSCLASINMTARILHDQDFHLVMTNLSPWITTVPWASVIPPAFAADLLIFPPHCLGTAPVSPNPFDHLDDFYKQLGNNVALWIGHGLAVVSSHFLLFAHKHQIDNWLLTANTASGCKPQIQTGSTIKFKR